MKTMDSFGTRSKLQSKSEKTEYFSLGKLEASGAAIVSELPFSIKILLESALRNENGFEVKSDDVLNIAKYGNKDKVDSEIPFNPARVLLQDFTGVPALVDLAALRTALKERGGDPRLINPQVPVDLVIDHSVQVDAYNSPEALKINADKEFERNRERYEFLHWGQKSFNNLRVIPPASGICHQVNLEYLAKVVQKTGKGADSIVYPDSLVGTDSHTTMINGLGVLGWGVGGIEAEAVMLGQPIFMLLPEVIGFKMTGELPPLVTATDLVLTVTEILRKKGVVGKFVEYFGPGLSKMSVPDRATLANMAPEYGATMGYFPVDDRTLEYLGYTGRDKQLIKLVEIYSKEQGLFRTDETPAPHFDDIVELDLSSIQPCVAGPKRPQDRINLDQIKTGWRDSLTRPQENHGFSLPEDDINVRSPLTYPNGRMGDLNHGNIVIAAITSCTNTSNPAVMLGAGILAKKAVQAGLKVDHKVKTSLAPGSKVVTDYLTKAGLMEFLEALGFHVVGYGCTTCIGNSGPLERYIIKAIEAENLIVASVLSGNRNFTGRINPFTKASFLMSPTLVVAFALAGRINIDFDKEPIGVNNEGKRFYLRDIMPTEKEVEDCMHFANNPDTFKYAYDGIEHSNEVWNGINASGGDIYEWDEKNTYIQLPPFFENLSIELEKIQSIVNARVLVKAGDSITTDHISPAGAIAPDSPAGIYLQETLGLSPKDFNSYGSRRGNDRVMVRGTFANAMFKNQLGLGKEGSSTTYIPTGEAMSIYNASLRYKSEKIPVIVLAGKDYGMGSSRDWAAKGAMLLGVKAVIAESFERIHRSNLIGMGILPLQFKDGDDQNSLGLTGQEKYTILIDDNVSPKDEIIVEIERKDGSKSTCKVICRLDSAVEIKYYRNSGILHTVLRDMFRNI